MGSTSRRISVHVYEARLDRARNDSGVKRCVLSAAYSSHQPAGTLLWRNADFPNSDTQLPTRGRRDAPRTLSGKLVVDRACNESSTSSGVFKFSMPLAKSLRAAFRSAEGVTTLLVTKPTFIECSRELYAREL